MKKFVVFNKEKGIKDGIIGTFDSKQEASNDIIAMCDDNDDATVFDYDIAIIDNKEANEIITDYESACEYLGGSPNTSFKLAQKNPQSFEMLESLSPLVMVANPKHVKAMIAMNKLFTIAQAWNKADGFVPDFSNRNQNKWFPWFRYSDDAAGFVYVYTIAAATDAIAAFGSRLCFKTDKRARQFGEQFTDLWNDFLLFR